MRISFDRVLTTGQVNDDVKAKILDLVKQLNHRAKILESRYGKVDVKELVNTGLFNLEVAQAGYGWLQDLHAMTVREVRFRMHPMFSLICRRELGEEEKKLT